MVEKIEKGDVELIQAMQDFTRFLNDLRISKHPFYFNYTFNDTGLECSIVGSRILIVGSTSFNHKQISGSPDDDKDEKTIHAKAYCFYPNLESFQSELFNILFRIYSVYGLSTHIYFEPYNTLEDA